MTTTTTVPMMARTVLSSPSKCSWVLLKGLRFRSLSLFLPENLCWRISPLLTKEKSMTWRPFSDLKQALWIVILENHAIIKIWLVSFFQWSRLKGVSNIWTKFSYNHQFIRREFTNVKKKKKKARWLCKKLWKFNSRILFSTKFRHISCQSINYDSLTDFQSNLSRPTILSFILWLNQWNKEIVMNFFI